MTTLRSMPAIYSALSRLIPLELGPSARKTVEKRSKKDVLRFKTQMNAVCWNRRLAMTKWDPLIGREEEALVPAHALVGDQIVVLYGCRVPVVLRKSGDGWTFVGDAYVPRSMIGMALCRTFHKVETFLIW